MTRGLLVFACVAIILFGVAPACGPPVTDVANPNSPQAQATNVRRTEVAMAQRIIANNPTATSTAAPTASAPPTCTAQGAIWWYEARTHIGESRTVQGTVVATRPAAGGLALLEIGQPYPDPIGMAVLLPAPAGSSLAGKGICVAGTIARIEGVPTIQLHDTATISLIDR